MILLEDRDVNLVIAEQELGIRKGFTKEAIVQVSKTLEMLAEQIYEIQPTSSLDR